mmetsp:Transcript_22160/g.48536  ORF Transcript_22160/g.48536 Transcript_22160/m.48536 type:complete len:81 (-) Transcript_22160:80-322(-)
MKVKVLLFGPARDAVGEGAVEVELADPTVAGLRTALAEQVPAVGPLLKSSCVAINQEYADDTDAIKETDEVALVPPISGG